MVSQLLLGDMTLFLANFSQNKKKIPLSVCNVISPQPENISCLIFASKVRYCTVKINKRKYLNVHVLIVELKVFRQEFL